MIDGQLHHFAGGGLYNGMVLLKDHESGTYWDHMTGEGLHGPLVGHQLEVWLTENTTVKAALQDYPDILLHQSSDLATELYWRKDHNAERDSYNIMQEKSALPGFFRDTMIEVDPRLPELTQGLGLFENDQARFYSFDAIPLAGLTDEWQGQPVQIQWGTSKLPYAIHPITGERPMQLLTRWYGFSLTFPDVELPLI